LVPRLKEAIPTGVEVLEGEEALTTIASLPDVDTVICAVVGAAGLPATLAAVEAGKDVAFANKESLVAGGAIVMPLVRQRGVQLMPIDSEPSAIFQAMHAGHEREVRKVFLTASGGPFRTWSAEQIGEATLEQALRHPTWEMGRKITIDSATMMNKALEIIEACWLFELDPDAIEVVIHPESIIHSMVEFCDGSVIAQMGSPDMRTPIQYALTFPERRPCCSRPLDIESMTRLSFEPPDFDRFPALHLGFDAARRGGTAGAVLNAANEVAVGEFCAGHIGFNDITRLTAEVLKRHVNDPAPTLDGVLDADRWAREEVHACLNPART
jgi:1-deoxy-D-xylulose-5-phosphate reductoisomerase